MAVDPGGRSPITNKCRVCSEPRGIIGSSTLVVRRLEGEFEPVGDRDPITRPLPSSKLGPATVFNLKRSSTACILILKSIHAHNSQQPPQ